MTGQDDKVTRLDRHDNKTHYKTKQDNKTRRDRAITSQDWVDTTIKHKTGHVSIRQHNTTFDKKNKKKQGKRKDQRKDYIFPYFMGRMNFNPIKGRGKCKKRTKKNTGVKI
jgi:hypothetical protein